MENAVPAILIGGILVLAAALLSGATTNSVSNFGDSWKQMEQLSEERLGTELSIVSAGLTGGDQVLEVTLRNTGRTSIHDFGHMDAIINYDGPASTRYNLWLPYTEESPQGDDTWAVSSIANDNKNPGILDTGEDITITVRLAQPVTGPANRWLSLATDAGVVYTVQF